MRFIGNDPSQTCPLLFDCFEVQAITKNNWSDKLHRVEAQLCLFTDISDIMVFYFCFALFKVTVSFFSD